MSFIKEKWFLIVNILIFAGSVALYFVNVAGVSESRAKEEKAIERDTRTLKGLANKKPTPAWDAGLEKTQASLSGQESYIYDEIASADNLIQKFFELTDSSKTTDKAPGLGSYLVYKSNFVKKWNELKDKYTQPILDPRKAAARSSSRGRASMPSDFFPEEAMFFEDPSLFGGAAGGVRAPVARRVAEDSDAEVKEEIKYFRCSPTVLFSLEPTWLRNDEVPKTELELMEAMKNYWIAVELLRILEVVDIDSLLQVSISPPMQTEAYKMGESMFWAYREVNVSFELTTDKTDLLWSEVHKSPLLFRAVGFDQRNILDLPEGVNSDAPHVAFDKLSERHMVTMNLWHFDYVQPGENLVAEELSGSNGSSRSRGRGRSRR